MARIEELNDSGIRVVYDDDGDISSLIDQRGRQMNIPLSKSDKITGVVKTIAVLTQAQYDALAVKDPNTEYNIVAA